MRPRLLGLIVVVALGCLGGTALAQDAKPDYDKAKQHYTKALQALDLGDYAIAAREFGAAYQITKDPILFYKIALSHEKAGDCESALVYYGRYLKEASPPEQERVEAEDRVAFCKKELGQTDAPVTGDGTGDGGGAGGTDILPPDVDDTPTGDGAKRQPVFIDEGTSWQRTAAWVSVGVAVAAGTTAAVLGLSASSREEDIETLVDFRDPVDNQPRRFEGEVKRQYEEFVDEGKDLQTYSRIAWAAAGAGAAAAVVFFILDAQAYAEEEEPAASALRPRVTPVVTDDTVGVSAGWRF